MKLFTSVLAVANLTQAHYNFPSMIYSGVTTTAWAAVRQWTDYYAYTPVTTVSTVDIRCNVNATYSADILSVAAGNTLGSTVGPDIYHPGPLLAYMAKVLSVLTAANCDGSGTVWFKIFQDEPVYSTEALTWPSNVLTVTGGGSGTPAHLVAFPGAYSATDPGILIDIYWPVPTNYTPPGPAVWTG